MGAEELVGWMGGGGWGTTMYVWEVSVEGQRVVESRADAIRWRGVGFVAETRRCDTWMSFESRAIGDRRASSLWSVFQ